MESYHAVSESPIMRGTQSSHRVTVEAVMLVDVEYVVEDVTEVDAVDEVDEIDADE